MWDTFTLGLTKLPEVRALASPGHEILTVGTLNRMRLDENQQMQQMYVLASSPVLGTRLDLGKLFSLFDTRFL